MSEGNDYRVLSIQSHVVSGYCGNKSAIFPLQTLGFEVDFINSVQFSNHTGYGKWTGHVLESNELLDLYDGLSNNHLNHKYTHLLTGYARSASFLIALGEIIKKIKKDNPNVIYVCDPVLGDNGKFYVPTELVSIYRDTIIPFADILKPNQFEAETLTNIKITDIESALNVIDKFHSIGIKTVVLSSVDIEIPGKSKELLSIVSTTIPCNNANSNANSNGNHNRQIFSVSITRKEGTFIGTGDIFASLFLAWFTKTNFNAKDTLEKVVGTIQAIIDRTSSAASLMPGGVTKPENIELKIVQSRNDIISPPISIHATPIKF